MKKRIALFLMALLIAAPAFAGFRNPQIIVPPIAYLDVDITDDYELQWGTGLDFVCRWDTNSTGDDLLVCNNKKLAATDTGAMFFARDLDPAAMTDFDNYLSPTLVFAVDEGADANDFGAAVIGPRATADVTTGWYFDFYSMDGAADGSADGTAAEEGPMYRFTETPAAASYVNNPGDVLFNGDIEVDGTSYFDGIANHYDDIRMGADDELTFGGEVSLYYEDDTSDDRLILKVAKSDADKTGAIIILRDQSVSGMTDFDNYLQPTLIMTNDEAADEGDFAGLVIGPRTTADVTAAWYFDLFATTGSFDGSVSGVAAELAPIIRIGNAGSATTGHGVTAGGVIFEDDIEVDGSSYFDGAVSMAGGSTIAAATPTLTFDDTDSASEVSDATIFAQATDTGAGSEDVDVTFTQQVNSTPTNFLVSNADGDLTLGRTGQNIESTGRIHTLVGAAEAARLSTNADDYTKFTMDANGGLTIESIDAAAAAANVAIIADGTFAVTSTGYNLSSAGAVSGVTTQTATGLSTITVGAAEAQRLATNADDYTSFTMDANGGLTIQSIDAAAAAANIAVTADGTFAVTSTGFNLSSAGALSGVTDVGMAGTIIGVTTAITGTKNNILTMSVPTQGADDAAGVGLVISADAGGSGGTGNNGGDATINAGDAGDDASTARNGGNIILNPGDLKNGGTDGAVIPDTDDDVDLGSAAKEFQDLYLDGTANIDSLVADTADINGGTVDGISALTVSGDVDIGAHDLQAATLSADGLTQTRLVVVGADGLLSDATVVESSGALSSITTIGMAGTLTGVTTAITGTKNNVLAISVPTQAADDAAGVGLSVSADAGGSGGTGNNGGDLTFNAGDAGDDASTARNGGNVILNPGDLKNGGADGAVIPDTDDDVDLGSASKEFQDLFLDGTANIDALVADTADINAGTVDAITSLTASGDLDIGAHDLQAATLSADTLTQTRLVVVGADGLLSDATVVESSGALSSITTIAMGGTLTGVTTAITGTANNILAISVPDQPDTGSAAGVGLSITADQAGEQAGSSGAGGDVTITAGDAGGDTGNSNGGDIYLEPGEPVNAGTHGNIVIGADHGITLVNNVTEFSTDGTMGGNSDLAVPTEAAIVTYVGGLAGVASMTQFVPVSLGGQLGQVYHGTYPVFLLDEAAEIAFFSWLVPTGFTSLTSAKIAVIPTTSGGNFDWTVDTSWAATGEDEANATDTATADAVGATDDQMLEIDVSAAFTGIAAGDWIGIKMTLDALSTTTELNVVGIEFVFAF